jgi:hypothetical protein
MEIIPILMEYDNSPTPWWGYLCGGVVPLVIAGFFYLCLRQLRLEQQSYLFEISKAEELKEGPCRIEGKIEPLNSDFISPWSKQQCVYYNFTVQGSGGSSSARVRQWVDLINDEQIQTFKVTDSSGSVEIDPMKSEKKVDLRVPADARKYFGQINDAPQELQVLLRDRYDYDKPKEQPTYAAPFIQFIARLRNKLLKHSIALKERRISENVLAVGSTVCVLGEAKRVEGKLVISEGETPLIVSENIERALEDRIPTKGLVIVTGIFAAIALFGFVVAGTLFFLA